MRTQAVVDALAATQCHTRTLDSWAAAAEDLTHLQPDLIVFGLEALLAEGPDTLWSASWMLSTFHIPALLIYSANHSRDIENIAVDAHFSAYLEWPAPATTLVARLNQCVPGIAILPPHQRAEGAHPFPEAYPDTNPSLTALPAWLDTEAERSPPEGRVVIPLPTLSSGSLAEISLPRLLYLLAIQRRSGELSLESNTAKLDIALHAGMPCINTASARDLQPFFGAFAWKEGSFRFVWNKVPQQQCQAVFPLLYDGIKRSHSLNRLMQLLQDDEQRYPAYTTLAVTRRQILQPIPRIDHLLNASQGFEKLRELFARSVLTAEDAVALVFAKVTDTILFFARAQAAPVSLIYQLAQRQSTSDATAFAKAPQAGTAIAIATLPPEKAQRLVFLEAILATLIESDPYTAIGLESGCGPEAVTQAIRSFRQQIFKLDPELEPPPLRITLRLIDAALRDASVLLCAQESDCTEDFEWTFNGFEPTAASHNPNPPRNRSLDLLAETAPRSEAEEVLLAGLQLRLTQLTRENPYQTFSLQPGCGEEAVRDAFLRVGEEHHPDRYANHPAPSIQRAAIYVYGALHAAYEHLLRAEKLTARSPRPHVPPKAQPALSLQDTLKAMALAERNLTKGHRATPTLAPPPPARTAPTATSPASSPPAKDPTPARARPTPVDPQPPPAVKGAPGAKTTTRAAPPTPQRPSQVTEATRPKSAPEIFRRAVRLLREERLQEASQVLAEAIQLDPEKETYRVYQIWAQHLAGDINLQDAKAFMKRALPQPESQEAAALFLGTLYLRDQDIVRANRVLQEAHQRFPNNVEIERALRLVRSRHQPTESTSIGGFVRRLLDGS